MRRKDKEIKGRKDIESIIRKADICRIAFSDNNTPFLFLLISVIRRIACISILTNKGKK